MILLRLNLANIPTIPFKFGWSKYSYRFLLPTSTSRIEYSISVRLTCHCVLWHFHPIYQEFSVLRQAIPTWHQAVNKHFGVPTGTGIIVTAHKVRNQASISPRDSDYLFIYAYIAALHGIPTILYDQLGAGHSTTSLGNWVMHHSGLSSSSSINSINSLLVSRYKTIMIFFAIHGERCWLLAMRCEIPLGWNVLQSCRAHLLYLYGLQGEISWSLNYQKGIRILWWSMRKRVQWVIRSMKLRLRSSTTVTCAGWKPMPPDPAAVFQWLENDLTVYHTMYVSKLSLRYNIYWSIFFFQERSKRILHYWHIEWLEHNRPSSQDQHSDSYNQWSIRWSNWYSCLSIFQQYLFLELNGFNFL